MYMKDLSARERQLWRMVFANKWCSGTLDMAECVMVADDCIESTREANKVKAFESLLYCTGNTGLP